ncbi:MAG: D-alanyl-D-alanine carboxypeptidase/D-alanyl-D-alanine endopeptidase [Pyrinomonadaceae bacterium]
MRSKSNSLFNSVFGPIRIRLVILLAIFLLFSNGCLPAASPSNSQENDQPQSDPGSEVAKSEALASGSAADAPLAREIDRLIYEDELASARWGVSVISLRDGRNVYARNADRLFTPASNMKLFPTSVGLELLGADYRWRTSVYAAAPPDATGIVAGDLVLYGRGAPDLVASPSANAEDSNSLTQLANDLYDRGVRRINGSVVGDESYFRGETLGDGWQWNDVQWYFGAEASALSINKNEVAVNVLPPDKSETSPLVKVNDPSGYVTIENKMTVVPAAERMTIGIHRGLSDNTVRVWGTFPLASKGFGARLSVNKPALWAAKLFRETLRARGITVDGAAQFRDARQPPPERFDPSKFIELAFVSSKPLSEIIKATNKGSINLYAELILRTIGRERESMLSTPGSGGRERGDDEAGLAVIHLWLNRSGVSTNGLALHDGSGLSRLNLVTPISFARLLVAISKSPAGHTFRDSLPLSGRDGTLGNRLTEHAERVSAKTGYLTYDTSLSGYVTTSDGEEFAFSIICNDETGRARSGRLVDQIVSLLATYPRIIPKKAH